MELSTLVGRYLINFSKGLAENHRYLSLYWCSQSKVILVFGHQFGPYSDFTSSDNILCLWCFLSLLHKRKKFPKSTFNKGPEIEENKQIIFLPIQATDVVTEISNTHTHKEMYGTKESIFSFQLMLGFKKNNTLDIVIWVIGKWVH